MEPEEIADQIGDEDDFDVCPECGDKSATIANGDIACRRASCPHYDKDYAETVAGFAALGIDVPINTIEFMFGRGVMMWIDGRSPTVAWSIIGEENGAWDIRDLDIGDIAVERMVFRPAVYEEHEWFRPELADTVEVHTNKGMFTGHKTKVIYGGEFVDLEEPDEEGQVFITLSNGERYPIDETKAYTKFEIK
jgi:hypothetical protein